MGAVEAPALPPPPAADRTPPKVTILTTKVRETQTLRVHIRARCTEQTHCGGTLSLSTFSKGHRYAAGTARFNILGGHTATVVISLRAKPRALLRKHSVIRVTAKATAIDLAGNVGHATRLIKVYPYKKPR
jgi:hypothetical protein